jgi:N6-adenosine-specific RNA methylase IME4
MKYGAILMDPPWSFKTWSAKGTESHRSAEQHYTTVALPLLVDMPVIELAAPDCALFMWAVDSHVEEAIHLARAWGFSYKTRAFDWVKTCKSDPTKPRMGMGYWTRKESEECLLFTQGKPKRVGKGVRQVIMAPRREHSRKPDEIYKRIEHLVKGPYLEMFARQQRTGWDSWGNEVNKFKYEGAA